MKKQFRLLLILLVGIVLLSTGAIPAQAHALLVRSIPAANASLPRSPAQVEIYFSEAIDPNLSKITVLDTNGAKVDMADSHLDPADPTHLIVSLGSLNNGVYTVTWSVISTSDGHNTSGSFPFAVGDVSAAALASAAQKSARNAPLPLAVVITQALLYLTAVTLMGGILFSLWVWRPAWRTVSLPGTFLEADWQIERKLILIALVLLQFAVLLSLLVQTGQATGTWIAPPWQPEFSVVLLQTRFGALAIARLGLAFALAILLLPPPNAWNRWIGLVSGLLLLLTFSLQSHALTDPQPLLPVLNDWVHLAAVSVWVGGLFSFLVSLRSTRQLPAEARTRLTVTLIPRFSVLAMSSVGVLILTGVYSAILRIGSFSLLFNTPYGKALIVKLLLAIPLLALGAINMLITTPRMQQAAARPDGDPDQVKHFYRLLSGEAVLGLLILVWVGVFTALPPARIPPAPVGIQQTSQADDLSIALNIDPGRVGVNTFTAAITANGQPLKNAQDVEMEFTSLSGKVAFSKAQMRDLGNGTYRLQGGYLGVPDQWDVKVVVTRPSRYDAYGIYQVNLSPTATISQSQSWQPVSMWLLVLMGILYILAFVVLDKHTRTSMGLDTVPFVAIILGALIIFFRPIVASNTNIPNPVPPNQTSILAGKALYQQNCQVCHGTTGKGDGPLSATLSPKPADLSIHGIPGIHTDGQLYYWISTGVPNTAMPVFGQKLSDKDIWNLVNFIRTLAYH